MAAWRVWVYAASTRGGVIMRMSGARYDCAVLRDAVGCALAVSVDRHGGGAHQFVGLAGIRKGVAAAGEHCSGNQRSGQIAERSHGREPFMSAQSARTLSAKVPLVH